MTRLAASDAERNRLDALTACLRAAVPQAEVLPGAEAREYAVAAGVPSVVCRPGDVGEVAACLRALASVDAAVVVAGLGRRLRWGRPPARCDVVLSTRRLDGVRAYEPADMTLVVEAGVTLAHIDGLLRPRGQRLPIDPPFPERTTVGGLIATDAFGPMRGACGRVRDHLIGVRAVLADGVEVKAGGRVVKNVAGYDMMKLFAGSMGTLGVVVEASFKLRPRPAQRTTGVWRASDLATALRAGWSARAVPFTPAMVRVVSGGGDAGDALGRAPALVVGLEGSAADLGEQRRMLAAVLPEVQWEWRVGSDAERTFAAARDRQACGAGRADTLGVRLGLRPEVLMDVLQESVLALETLVGASVGLAADVGAGTCFLRLRGMEDAGLVDAVGVLRERAERSGGFAVVDDVPERLAARIDPWGEVAGFALMRGVKLALDPARRLSPGRFVGGL